MATLTEPTTYTPADEPDRFALFAVVRALIATHPDAEQLGEHVRAQIKSMMARDGFPVDAKFNGRFEGALVALLPAFAST